MAPTERRPPWVLARRDETPGPVPTPPRPGYNGAVSWSCPNVQEETGLCRRLSTDCVPGRPGCVLPTGWVFAIPVEERIRERALEGRRAEGPAGDRTGERTGDPGRPE